MRLVDYPRPPPRSILLGKNKSATIARGGKIPAGPGAKTGPKHAAMPWGPTFSLRASGEADYTMELGFPSELAKAPLRGCGVGVGFHSPLPTLERTFRANDVW